jgi:tetratricopeptide (TPR) repeat protein
MIPELLKNKRVFPPKNTVYQVKVDGVPIGIVLKREDKSDYYGHQAMLQNNAAEALAQLNKALQYDPYNEQALEDLITIYPQIGMPDSALALAQRWVTFNRGNTTALNQLANLYYARGDYSNALLAANSIIKYNSRDISGLWIAAHVYAEQNKFDNAIRTLQRLLGIRGDYTPAYEFMAEIFERAGDKRQAQQIRDAIR